MVATVVVKVGADGRMTLPMSVRKALKLTGVEARVSVDISDGTAVLRPAVVVPRDDAWAYTPEHLASVRRALGQVEEEDWGALPPKLSST